MDYEEKGILGKKPIMQPELKDYHEKGLISRSINTEYEEKHILRKKV